LRMVRLADAPRKIHVDVVPSDVLSGGAGEPGVPPVAPAIANAVFALTGKRVRDLPLSAVFTVRNDAELAPEPLKTLSSTTSRLRAA